MKDVDSTLLWHQASEAKKLNNAEIRTIIAFCQHAIQNDQAAAEDYVQLIACQLELTERGRSQGT